MSDGMRLDAALVARGICGGRDKAKTLITSGHVTVDGKTVTKASTTVSKTADIACDVRERFVGRGGEKLLKVLEQTAMDISGSRCADIGASTGGFTDCLLQHGAEKVFAIDVGHDQLAASLRNDARVVSMEGVDVRDRECVRAQIADASLDMCTVDVSFISLTAVWDSLVPLLKSSGRVVCLIKPQFEAGRAALSKRGVVKNPKDHCRVLHQLLAFWQEHGCGVQYLSHSPILGGEGNLEYIAVVSLTPCERIWSAESVVRTAFESFSSEK